jgi:hypothetical protein
MASHVVGRRCGDASVVFVLVTSLVTLAAQAQQNIGRDFLVTKFGSLTVSRHCPRRMSP